MPKTQPSACGPDGKGLARPSGGPERERSPGQPEMPPKKGKNFPVDFYRLDRKISPFSSTCTQMNPQSNRIDAFLRTLEPACLAEVERISKEEHYKKGELLLRQDEVCRKSYLIKSGIARKYYLNDGKEMTTELYFENDLAMAFDSYSLQQPGKEWIEALTDLTVSAMDYHAFQSAKKRFPKLLELDLMLTEYYAMWVENRLFEFHTQSATERYLDLLENHPHIIRQVPLTIVASYLGISLETLSRIRARI